MTVSNDVLEFIFGADSNGSTPEQRARTSRRIFVRSQHQLSFHEVGATGRQLNANEALEAFGWQTLEELAFRPAAPIIAKSGEPYATLDARAKELDLDIQKVALAIGWDEKTLDAFYKRRQVPFRRLERLAQALALDERVLGVVPGAKGDRELFVRLRELKSRHPVRFSQAVILGLAEAAWVIRKQIEIESRLNPESRTSIKSLGFSPSENYGSKDLPAWKLGYDLARYARKLLKILPDRPIENLRTIIEDQLSIPIIHWRLPEQFAGATIANGPHRGIVVNLDGLNKNVWIRRMTLAHELGHLLWDPDSRLRRLHLDEYAEVLVESPDVDYVEMRANGFAIEFLAPGTEAISTFKESRGGAEGLSKVMSKFGISRTAAANHLYNVSHGEFDVSKERVKLEPSADWNGREEFTVSYFVPDTVPYSRRGRFAFDVSALCWKGFISKNTAAALLSCDTSQIDEALKFLGMTKA